MSKRRLDSLLVERGLFDSRSSAAAAVLAGAVRIGSDGRSAAKPGQMVRDDVELAVHEAPPFVSRGGIKLANALDRIGIDPEGRRCLDVGASTGGFTDCLLKRGAVHVVALDVAYGELDWGLRNDPRVTVIERANARELEPRILPYAPELAGIGPGDRGRCPGGRAVKPPRRITVFTHHYPEDTRAAVLRLVEKVRDRGVEVRFPPAEVEKHSIDDQDGCVLNANEDDATD